MSDTERFDIYDFTVTPPKRVAISVPRPMKNGAPVPDSPSRTLLARQAKEEKPPFNADTHFLSHAEEPDFEALTVRQFYTVEPLPPGEIAQRKVTKANASFAVLDPQVKKDNAMNFMAAQFFLGRGEYEVAAHVAGEGLKDLFPA